MKWLLLVKMMILTLSLAACSGGKKKSDASPEDESLYSMESEDSDLISEDDEDFLLSDDEQDSEEEIELSSPAEEEKLAQDSSSESVEDDFVEEKSESDSVETVADTSSSSDSATESYDDGVSDLSVYQVQGDSETLMLIAFNIYGDYTKWREIAKLNRDMFDDRYIVKKGMMLKFKVPDTQFKWDPQGDPYLIRSGDTLSGISNHLYDTFARWKELWQNNRPLIKNPNRIFAGFTLYYTPVEKEEQSDLAQGEGSVEEDRQPTSL